jgi:uncharacterized protein DUF4365
MRAPKTEAKGSGGEKEVAAKFAYMGWAANIDAEHDNGVDMSARPRDARRFELGMYLGVQVKTGASYFEHPKKDENGEVVGWWFIDDDGDELGARARFPTPQIVVLHDERTHNSYWEHVTSSAIRSTGKGAKILVPASKTLDEEHLDELLAVTASFGADTLEGNWGEADISPTDLLRHALLAPRLVAPHPNLGSDDLSPEQALAMVAQFRIMELNRYSEEQESVPRLNDTLGSKDWRWRFVGALWRRMEENEAGPLSEVLAAAKKSEERAAVAVCLAALMTGAGSPEEALAVLDPEIARDQASTVDHAWLVVQRARALAEVGRRDEALEAIATLATLRDEAPSDVTAKAIAATATTIAFNISDWGERDFRELIKGGESIGGWWRSQVVRTGLDAALERSFEEWAEDSRVKWSNEDTAHSRLFAAAVEASHSGDQAGWRNLSGTVGKDELLRLDHRSDPEYTAEALTTLRLAGDEKGLKLAIPHVRSGGPCLALRPLLGDLDLARSTRTSAFGDLLLVEQAGDLAEEVAAGRLVAWLLATISEPKTFATRTTPHYLLDVQLVASLAGIVAAAGVDLQRQILEQVISGDPVEDNQLLAQGWARTLAAIAEDAWTTELSATAFEASSGHEAEVGDVLRALAARSGDPDAIRSLIDAAREGDIDALWGLGAVRDLPVEVIAPAAAALAAQVGEIADEARGGSVSFGPRDPAQSLARVNGWHPGHAMWEPLFDLLEEPAVPGRLKRSAVLELSWRADQLAEEVRDRLRPIALKLASGEHEPGSPDFDGTRDIAATASVLAVSVGAWSPEESNARLADFLAGGRFERRYGALIATQLDGREAVGVLATLGQDHQSSVRAQAAAGLASRVANGLDDALAGGAFRRCLEDPGRDVPLAIARSLIGIDWKSEQVELALERLSGHPSAAVRDAAREALALDSSKSTS